MQVFLSWSGERSRLVADALRTWLPKVIQSIKPWMSSSDISVGSRWLMEVSGVLDASSIGIICVTQENLTSPWLHFEAGALSKALDQSQVCPVAFELTPGQISGPLAQFQSVSLNQSGVKKLLMDLNNALKESALPEAELEEIHDVWWPRLEERLAAIPKAPEPKQVRQVGDQIEELLEISREQLRRENLRLEAQQSRDERLDSMIQMMERATSTIAPLRENISSFHNTLQSAKASMENLSVEKEEDAEQANKILETLMSVLSNASVTDIDTQPIHEITELLKSLQEEDKQRTQSMLNTPNQSEGS